MLPFLTLGEDRAAASIPAIVFAQIPPLVFIGAILGSLSANAGLMLVLGYAMGDYLLAGPQLVASGDTLLHSFFYIRLPLLLSYVLFFLLAVLPVVSTNYLLEPLYGRVPGRDPTATAIRIGAMAVVQGLFIHEWIFIAPMTMRVVLGGKHAAGCNWLFSPGDESLDKISAVSAVVVRGWLAYRAENNPAVIGRMQRLDNLLSSADAPPPPFGQGPWWRVMLLAVLFTLLISGFINSLVLGVVITNTAAAILLAHFYFLPRFTATSQQKSREFTGE